MEDRRTLPCFSDTVTHNPRGRGRGVHTTMEQQSIGALSLYNGSRGCRGVRPSSSAGTNADDSGPSKDSKDGIQREGFTSLEGVRGSKRPELGTCVRSRPADMTSKKGTSGAAASLLVNYFNVQRKKDPSGGAWSLYQYHVSFEPEVDQQSLRKGLLKSVAAEIGPHISRDGTALYKSRPFDGGKSQVLMVKNRRDGAEFKLTIALVQELSPTDPMYVTFYNILLKTCQQQLGLTEMGSNFFDSEQKKPYPALHLELWPGFVTVLRQHEQQLLLCVEVTHKVLRTETVLQVLSGLRSQFNAWTDAIKAKAESELVGTVVMTVYNKRTYRIDAIDWTRNLTDTFVTKAGPVTFVDYYKTKYDLEVNRNQPLLISNPKKRDVHRGLDRPFVLVPEFCQMTGLTEKLRSNFAAMKDLNVHLQMIPETRMKAVSGFVTRINNDEKIKNHLKDWGLRLAPQPLAVTGRVLEKEKLSFGGHSKPEYANEKADWTQAFAVRRREMLSCVPLRLWVMIVPEKVSAQVENLYAVMSKVSVPLGFEMSRPEFIKIRSSYPPDYSTAIDQVMANYGSKLDLIFVILPNNKVDVYSTVKKRTYLHYGIPSQCFLAKHFNKPKNLMSVATKVVIQMNTKLGGEPWSVNVPVKNMMVVGFDVYHGSTGEHKGKTVGAMCATLSKNCSKYFNTVSWHSDHQELSSNICANMIKCLTAYKKENGQLPERVLAYRDGVGEGQLAFVHATELENMKQAIKSLYESDDLENPKLTFIVVTKRIHTRILAEKGGRCENPLPGTVVDDVITLPERYDFFLVAQSVNQATVSPTSFHVLADDSGLDPDKIQRMTFKMCHGYFNWSGTTAVPAPVQYAHKLAQLTGSILGSAAHSSLSNQLYFL